MQHDKLIERLGGYRALAERLGRDPSTVFKWQRTGIPAEFWPALARLARARGIRGASVDAIERNSPLHGTKECCPPQVS